MYPKIFKRLALLTPVLGQIVSERDRLRDEISKMSVSDCHNDNQNSGYCHCCRRDTIFRISGDWLRDQYVCLNCFSIPRQRHIQYVMDYYFTRWESKNIHESSPSNNLISQYCNHYTSSQYFSDIAEGSVVNGLRCENLESLTFPDNSFDIFITQDVLEHVFNPNIAVNEIMRVLKPGGVHIFTAPKHKGMALSKPRAILVGEDVDYLDEPMYHGNPIGDGKSLVTWDYGNDFEELISKWSNASTTTYVTRDRKLGLDGEYLEVFVTKKNNN